VGLAARGHARDQILGLALVTHRHQWDDVVRLRIERHDSQPVLRVQQIERGERGGLRHFDLLATHARGAVDEQDHVQVLVLAPGLEGDRQQLLHFAVAEAFLTVRVLPRGEDQSTATVANERAQALHGVRPEAVGTHIAEDDDVLAVEQRASSDSFCSVATDTRMPARSRVGG
jgi:hypothetical protein